MKSLKKQIAADIIAEHFRCLVGRTSLEAVLVSAEEAGMKMVEIYRALTGEMPQAPGIEELYFSDETPAVEFVAPTERRPDEIAYVHPGELGEPDIIIKGDQHGDQEKDLLEEAKLSTDGAGSRPTRGLLPGPSKDSRSGGAQS